MIRRSNYKYFFYLTFCAATYNGAYAQDIKVADSLVREYESSHTEIHDSVKFDLLLHIAENHPVPEMRIHYAEKALEIAQKEENDYWKAYCHNFIGYGHKLKGDLNRAINSFYTSIGYFEKANDKTGVATVYSAIGDTYSAGADHTNSIVFYRKAIRILAAEGHMESLATVMLNLGDEFSMKNELDSALKYSYEALKLYRELGNKSGEGYCLGNIGTVLSKSDKLDSAEKYITDAIAILEVLGDNYPVSSFRIILADIYKNSGDFDRALEHAHKSLLLAEQDGLKEQMKDASLLLSEIYSVKKDFEKAYFHQKQYITFRDSINSDEVIRKMADLRTEYEISQKQAEVDLLEQKSKTQSIVNFGLVVVVLLLILLALIIYQNSQKRKKVNQLLSEQKQEIGIQRDQLEELVHMKDRFFGIISHDLRSPVNSLQGITQLLRHYVVTKQIDQIEEFVGLTDKSINNLSSLLDNLLSWALSQQGSLPYNPERFKYYFVAEEVKRIFQNMALSKRIKFDVMVPRELEIWADRDSIFAMTRNLVNNAIKFTPEKGKVCLEAMQEDNYIKIVVSDTGIGIPKEMMAGIFDFDKQKSTKGTAGEKGSGLGLALCHDIVRLNHGDIKIKSQEREGTIITAYIPTEKG